MQSVLAQRFLSKSKFCVGLQCLRRLWWTVHDAGAPELRPDPALDRIFTWGHRVGALAHERFPGGVLVPFEQERGAYGAVDVLERRSPGWTLVEVKATVETKSEHVPDAAFQLFAARAAGVDVRRVEIMHLNRACRAPDLSNLFVRDDVTEKAEALQAAIPLHLGRMHAALACAEAPAVDPATDCEHPNACPFQARCSPALPEHHVSTLYRIGRTKLAELAAAGIDTIHALPADHGFSGRTERQVRSVRSGSTVVEAGLAEALRALAPPVAYLDFETVAPPVPAWNGCAPYDAVPVQMSCHVVASDGTVVHHAYLAEPGSDPRPAMAEAVAAACADAMTVAAYNAPFEARCLDRLAVAVPARSRQLLEVRARLVDLLPIVADHVYHPLFHGSFSIKSVLPALVPGLGYEDLDIADGNTASAALEELLLEPAVLSPAERDARRNHLLAYCERDTVAMLKLVERLRQLA